MSHTQINKIVDSVVAKVKASTVFGTKYCNAAPNSKQTAEKYNAFAGTAREFKRPNAFGPCSSRDKPNNIREVENTPLFIDDMTDDNTTKFIIIAAAAIPAWLNKFTKGEMLGSMVFQGVTDITITSAST